MVGEANSEMLRRIDEKLDRFSATTENSNSLVSERRVSLKEENVLTLLDHLDRARAAAEPGSQAFGSIEAVAEALLGAAGLNVVAVVNQPYDPVRSEIVYCDSSGASPAGAVASVVMQGYKRADGSMLRIAKVAVSASGEQSGGEEG